jgi:phosphoribosyl-AMP cyclohydrolase
MGLELDFEKENGLIPAIVQDAANDEVLMLGFMNREAFEKTQATGYVTFFSRSRQQLWTKGESSGQKLVLRELLFDCDQDALLLKVELAGVAVCHEGYRSCFYRRLERDGAVRTIASQMVTPDELYGAGAREKKA